MTNEKRPSRRHPLDLKYGDDYFHGKGSGYSKAGYENEHADWTSSIEWMKSCFGEDMRWLDAGCAYGFLVDQAKALGVDAVGVDISSYALRQRPDSDGRIVQGLVEPLPFKNASFDVVSLFDILEHVTDPEAVVDEVIRVLKENGVCLISTPDPLHFDRPEPSHIHERPPSYWVRLFEQRGFRTAIRFGSEPYELELAACRSENGRADEMLRDFETVNSSLSKAIQTTGDRVCVTPRSARMTTQLQSGDAMYVLNPETEPLHLSLTIQTETESHPDLFLGDLKIRYLEGKGTDGKWVHRWSPVKLPPGGCDLTVRHKCETYPVGTIDINASRMDRKRFLLELPFDHYQRYRTVSEAIEGIGKGPFTILDAGGALGFLSLFAPEHPVTVLDRVWEDTPQSVRYEDACFPYKDESFDIVVCVDTLEHIPAGERQAFLAELNRVSSRAVILCGPYAEPNVAEAESVIRDFLSVQYQRRDRFLDEHQDYTLPNLTETLAVFEPRTGFSITTLPNGYLPRWLAMQMAVFSLSVAPELADGRDRLNALYNENYFEKDNCFPAYRTLAVVARQTIAKDIEACFKQMTALDPASDSPVLWNVAGLIVALSNLGLIREKDALLTDQGNQLTRLLDHIENLDSDLDEERSQRKQLLVHTENLDALQQSHLEHAENVDHLLKESVKESQNHQKLNVELQQHNSSLLDHSEKLQVRIEELQKQNADVLEHGRNLETHITNLSDHTKNLETRNQALETHIENLDGLLQSNQTHAANLESMLSEKDKHATNLESILKEKAQHARHLENELARIQDRQDRTCNALLAMMGATGSEDGADALAQLDAMVHALTGERNELKSAINQYLSSRRYQILAKLGLIPPIKEPSDE